MKDDDDNNNLSNEVIDKNDTECHIWKTEDEDAFKPRIKKEDEKIENQQALNQ